MSDWQLVVVDTVGIQSYIFGSNRLRENVGASHLVQLATAGWLKQEPHTLLPARHNIINGKISEQPVIEANGENGADAEVLFAGGGNTAILFRDPADATAFTRNLSERLLCGAPGLDVVLVQQAFTWQASLAQTLTTAFKALEKQKAQREYPQPLLGLGVTEGCRSTGLVANYEIDDPGEARFLPLSSTAYAKWLQNKAAKQRLRDEMLSPNQDGQAIAPGYEIPDEFDELGRLRGDQSYLAVVHADGNGMGKLFEELTKRHLEQKGDANRAYICALRRLSANVNTIGLNALRKVMRTVWEWHETVDNESVLLPPFEKHGARYLGIRPIVFGGDDVTFVCNGRIGLWAAQVFLDAFSQQTIVDETGRQHPAQAAAGVAIVKVRYPFARAYELSEQLCKNAKTVFERKETALDWHIAQSGLFGDLAEIRQREYQEEQKGGRVQRSLLMRPLTLQASATTWRTWDNFVHLTRTFQDREQWSRNKVLDLRGALRADEHTVRQFVINYERNTPGQALPALSAISDHRYRKTGWYDDRAVYFDAIEMIDQLLPAAMAKEGQS